MSDGVCLENGVQYFRFMFLLSVVDDGVLDLWYCFSHGLKDAPWLAIDDWDFCSLILLSLPMFIMFAIKWFWRDCSAVNSRIVLMLL